MKMTSLLLLGCFITAILSSSVAFGLTINEQVTPAYVREHSKEWSVEVTKGTDDLIHFTIKHDVETPKYHVAHLAVYHQSKLIATSDTPSFGKKRGNTFYFSLAAEDVAASKFELSDSALSGTGDEAVPVVGTTVYQFQLRDFVPVQLPNSAEPATTERFNMRATVTDVTMLQQFTGTVVRVQVDPRFALTLRIESMIPPLTNYPTGSLVTFAIHSPTRLFAGEAPKGKTLDFVLTRETKGSKRTFTLEVQREGGERAL